ncbi:hypothetical protein KP509_19G015500 [Ceratopteris richardii]|uniref:Uncharacterized protein n=1 Tax=Ceratopteris richardii TaxID=49495 RepID=A0A8T2SIY7_CERRI|nr:hypothetical protein KP509_19G015500 [Ceratopteris richardii]
MRGTTTRHHDQTISFRMGRRRKSELTARVARVDRLGEGEEGVPLPIMIFVFCFCFFFFNRRGVSASPPRFGSCDPAVHQWEHGFIISEGPRDIIYNLAFHFRALSFCTRKAEQLASVYFNRAPPPLSLPSSIEQPAHIVPPADLGLATVPVPIIHLHLLHSAWSSVPSVCIDQCPLPTRSIRACTRGVVTCVLRHTYTYRRITHSQNTITLSSNTTQSVSLGRIHSPALPRICPNQTSLLPCTIAIEKQPRQALDEELI